MKTYSSFLNLKMKKKVIIETMHCHMVTLLSYTFENTWIWDHNVPFTGFLEKIAANSSQMEFNQKKLYQRFS